ERSERLVDRQSSGNEGGPEGVGKRQLLSRLEAIDRGGELGVRLDGEREPVVARGLGVRMQPRGAAGKGMVRLAVGEERARLLHGATHLVFPADRDLPAGGGVALRALGKEAGLAEMQPPGAARAPYLGLDERNPRLVEERAEGCGDVLPGRRGERAEKIVGG